MYLKAPLFDEIGEHAFQKKKHPQVFQHATHLPSNSMAMLILLLNAHSGLSSKCGKRIHNLFFIGNIFLKRKIQNS
jgi:hypothetical protein